MHAFRYAWVGILLILVQPAAAQDDGDEGDELETDEAVLGPGPERCIPLNRIQQTEVIDDRTLIFHMAGGGIYLNHLARECPGLKREERFMYSPTGSRLCSIDTVTVLEDFGFGLGRGFTCSLGQFHPISDADLAELKRGIGEADDDGLIEVEPVDPETLGEVLGDDGASEDGSSEDEE